MEWGPQLEHLLRIEAQGQFVPALNAMPELDPIQRQFWDAFQSLDTAREWGAGFPQPIKITEIESYARMRAFAQDELDDLIRIVQTLDREYLKRQAKRKNAGTQSSN